MSYRKPISCSRGMITNLFKALVLSLAVGFALAVAGAQKTVPVVTGDEHVDQILNELSLQEKIALLHGTEEPSTTSQGQAGYTPGVPRLGIPAMRYADGPPGVLTRVPSTAPTCTMGLAATFSMDDARANGTLIAREAKSHGVDVVLQPFINIDRDITWDRGYDTFGEDPFLTGQLGAAEISGIQSQGIMAQAKHFIAYETGGESVYVDQQALHEIYLAPFAAAIQADVSSIMCSYNKINGLYSCGNQDTLNKILKQELGFKGFVTSDWGATHDTDFINAGLDMEMPGPSAFPGAWPSFFENNPSLSSQSSAPLPTDDSAFDGLPEEPKSVPWQPDPLPTPTTNLRALVKSGVVKEDTITYAAGRVLYEMDRFGMLDGKHTRDISQSPVSDSAKIIEKTGEDAAVLLKNDGDVLPLRESDLASLAFVGPGAGQTIAVGLTGEKAVGLPGREIGTVEALTKLLPTISSHVIYASGDDMEGSLVPAAFFSHDGRSGLQRRGRGGKVIGDDHELNFTNLNGNPLPVSSTITWMGTLQAPSSGLYRLHLQALGCYATLRLDGKTVAANGFMWLHGDVTQAGQDNVLPTRDGLDNLRVEIQLHAGPHVLSVSIAPDHSNNPAQIRLNWVTPEDQTQNYERAIAAARKAHTVIVFAWSRGRPNFALPGDQDRLIADIAAANPRTIVVLNVSQPVAMPWLDQVKAVLQMWWPGDEGGWATANILLGKANPAGRLPFTWPRRLEDSAPNDPAFPERSGKGVNGKTTYSEGVLVGYRWFDTTNKSPLFPFGFGLSYTRFEYSGLQVAQSTDGGLDLIFEVKNAGRMAGDEVPQVYLDAPDDRPKGVQFAARTLAGFSRIHLEPHESTAVSLHVPLRSLQYWSTEAGAWVTPTSARSVEVGASSRDLRLHSRVEVGVVSRAEQKETTGAN